MWIFSLQLSCNQEVNRCLLLVSYASYSYFIWALDDSSSIKMLHGEVRHSRLELRERKREANVKFNTELHAMHSHVTTWKNERRKKNFHVDLRQHRKLFFLTSTICVAVACSMTIPIEQRWKLTRTRAQLPNPERRRVVVNSSLVGKKRRRRVLIESFRKWITTHFPYTLFPQCFHCCCWSTLHSLVIISSRRDRVALFAGIGERVHRRCVGALFVALRRRPKRLLPLYTRGEKDSFFVKEFLLSNLLSMLCKLQGRRLKKYTSFLCAGLRKKKRAKEPTSRQRK